MIGLSFEIFEDNEKDVWRQVAKEKDDFSPIHKKFIAKLLNANSETYKFWKAFERLLSVMQKFIIHLVFQTLRNY